MPFMHKVDEKLDVVIIKAIGEVSIGDIMSEIQEAIDTKRGDGITRRLVDMTDQEFIFNEADARKILTMLQVQGKALRPKKVALLFKQIPENFDFEKIRWLLNTEFLEIGVFTDKGDAVTFLNNGRQR
jgi:hypothetical protein